MVEFVDIILLCDSIWESFMLAILPFCASYYYVIKVLFGTKHKSDNLTK